MREHTAAHRNMKGSYAMPDDLGWDSFDRRHFMVTAIGASAMLAASITRRVPRLRLHHEEQFIRAT